MDPQAPQGEGLLCTPTERILLSPALSRALPLLPPSGAASWVRPLSPSPGPHALQSLGLGLSGSTVLFLSQLIDLYFYVSFTFYSTFLNLDRSISVQGSFP